MEAFLVFRRTGKTIAAVLAGGFGGGTVLLGVGSAVAEALTSTASASTGARAILPALQGYLLASSPFFLLALLIALCRRELWFLPELGVFRMLTFRPWLLRGPRVEQAPLDEYRALCTEQLDERSEGSGTLVSLITESGECVPVREFKEPIEARAFLEELADVTGLPRGAAANG
jgi:hypothetical protein